MIRRKYGAAVLMASIAIIFLILHFWSGWEAFVDEASAQGQSAEWGEYLMVWMRDTVENMQSEFWQLAVQFALLAGLFRFVGVQAYEEDEEDVKQHLNRLESKLDEIQKSRASEFNA